MLVKIIDINDNKNGYNNIIRYGHESKLGYWYAFDIL